MRETILLLICLSVLASWSLVTPSEAASVKVLLLETGEFHGDEVKARTGERWLGLYVSGNKSSLIPSTVTVERVHDPVVDEAPSIKTGKKVTVNRSSDPIFLIQGAGMLRPGAVSTIFAERSPLTNKSNFSLKLAGVEYRLKVNTKDQSPTEAISLDDAKLVLSRGKDIQVLYALGGRGSETEAWWNLLWVGDVDGDKKLDVYVEVSDHYNVSERKLFLSSQARRGQLVREVAKFRIVGC